MGDVQAENQARQLTPLMRQVVCSEDPDNLDTPGGTVSSGLVQRGLAAYRRIPMNRYRQAFILTDFGREVRDFLLRNPDA